MTRPLDHATAIRMLRDPHASISQADCNRIAATIDALAKRISDLSQTPLHPPGAGTSPHGLTTLLGGLTWESVDGNLQDLNSWLIERENRARITAAAARKAGNLVKWTQFNAIARAHAMARRRFDENLGIPF